MKTPQSIVGKVCIKSVAILVAFFIVLTPLAPAFAQGASEPVSSGTPATASDIDSTSSDVNDQPTNDVSDEPSDTPDEEKSSIDEEDPQSNSMSSVYDENGPTAVNGLDK